MKPYWLCCGSLVHREHKRGCNEHLIGHRERRRFGTAEEHREWMKDAYLVSMVDSVSKNECSA